ncbi:hypothetical protein HK103_007676 [Boothiomyces macroporosus]|uniref:RRM domain-containing protein n=1 Tax=Boothiomyces macroporosus TaxID=261099 RepID=A0AAD5UG38_9FUNG|nr:hypothetical protein HK103_007676 [Boothiomyces macroporosus]
MFRSKSWDSPLDMKRLSMTDRRNYPPLLRRRVKIEEEDLVDAFDQLDTDGAQPINAPSSTALVYYGNKVEKALPTACLFVASLCINKTDEQLSASVYSIFKKYGELLNIKVLRDLKQRPFSFVQFKNHQDADRAFVEAAGTVLHGRKIRIEKAKVNRTIYASRIKDMNEEQLRSVFEQFGEIEDLQVLRDYATGDSKGSVFVKYCYREDAACKVKYDWVVEWSNNLEKADRQRDPYSIFVGKLDLSVTKEVLQQKFSEFGKIVECQFLGESKGLKSSFIQYESAESVKTAIKLMNGQVFCKRIIKVEYKEIHNAYEANVSGWVWTEGMYGLGWYHSSIL